MTLQPHIALDTLTVVGRTRELDAIGKGLVGFAEGSQETNSSQAIILRGPGGIGKTRLLRRSFELAQTEGLLCSGIIDLYHPDTHSNSGIERAILLGSNAGHQRSSTGEILQLGGIDPQKAYFQEYWQKREEYERLRNELVDSQRLEALRQELSSTFVLGYNARAKDKRVVLTFDTTELVQYESDEIQKIARIEQGAVEVRSWLVNVLPRLNNTLIIIAGRGPREERPNDPRIRLWRDILAALSQQRCQIFELNALSDDETVTYFDAVAEAARHQASSVQSDQERAAFLMAADRIGKIPEHVRRRIHSSTEGRPVRLGIAIDLLLFGNTEFESELSERDWKWSDLVLRVVDRLQELASEQDTNTSILFDYLACTRLGLNPLLLNYLEPTWNEAECARRLSDIQTLSFVKLRPGTDDVFLHDEMYDLLEESVIRNDPGRFKGYYEKMVTFYQQGNELEKVPEECQVPMVHYALLEDVNKGYSIYSRFNEKAIKGHHNSLDMKLRDEVLRHYDDPKRKALAEKAGLPRLAIDRDCAVRWVKRHLMRNDFKQAFLVAESILASGPQLFARIIRDASGYSESLTSDELEKAQKLFASKEAADDTFFWASLLTFYGEALLYLGKPENEILPVLEQAVLLMGEVNARPEDEFGSWRRDRILGRAHNNIGYLHWAHGRYGRALDEFKTALPYFKQANIRDERADTLNNLAFLLALMGRVDLARTHIDQAIQIRRDLGQQFPLALSYNTRGYVFTYNDHPMWGCRDCSEALRIAKALEDDRGIGLACNGLGFALRKRGDQWKQDIYAMQESEDFFTQSEEYLKKAAQIFTERVTEPIRLWEAYNELGSLYCDWGWLLKHQDRFEAANQKHETAERFQLLALEVASQHDLVFQMTDSCDDLAQLFADMGDFDQAERWLQRIETELVPPEYHLIPGFGFAEGPEPGATFWLSLGKVYRQRGIWAFRLVDRDHPSEEERLTRVHEGIRQFAVAIAYFQRYWARSDALGVTLRSFAKYVGDAGVTTNQARVAVEEVSSDYQIDLRTLLETIADSLGI